VIGITAAALTACGGAVCLFLKHKAKKRYYTAFTLIAALFLCGVMGAGMTAYAANIPGMEIEPGTAATETDTEPDEVIEVITGEEIEIDIGDFLDPDKQPNQLTPPGNLTLVDDLSGAQADEKQFITVTTKNGNYFYIIIDRAGNKENVYFLNLVDEYDLLQILQGEDAETPPLPPGMATTPPTDETPGQDTEPTPAPQPRQNNTAQLLIMLAVIAAIGGGAFYYFKVLKPKQGANKKTPVKSELDEFDFDADDDDLFIDSVNEPDGRDYNDTDNDGGEDEEIPDFTLKNEPDGGDDFNFNFGAETPESEGGE
jgi:flagellar basal body-associated protein FliL